MDVVESNKRPDDVQGGGLCSTKVDLSQLCRVCANSSDCLIPIFEGEGLEHELESKIHKHLPIKVSSSGTLPVHLCYQCASTLVAWNDLVVSCVEADKRLHQLFLEAEKEKTDFPSVDYDESTAVDFGVDDGCDDSYSSNRVEEVPGTSSQVETSNVPVVQPVKKRTIRTRLSDKIYTNNKGEEKTLQKEKQDTTEERFPSSITPFKAYHQSQIALRSQQAEVQLNIKADYVDGEPVFCPYCGKMFMTYNEMTNHISQHMQQLLLKCNHCNNTFSQQADFEEHLMLHNKDDTSVEKKKNHNVAEEFICNFCGVMFNKRIDEIKHKRNYHSLKDIKPDASGKFPCNVCGKYFARAFHMQFHKEKHHVNINEPVESVSAEVDDKKFMNYCDTCNKSFSRKFDLKRHVLKAHGAVENQMLSDIDISRNENTERKNNDVENSGVLMNGTVSDEYKICDRATEQLKEVKKQEKIKSDDNGQNLGVNRDETDNSSVNSEEISRHLDIPVTSTAKALPEIKLFVRSHKCTLCNHAYTRKHDMLKHRRSAHTLEERKKDPFEATLNNKKIKHRNAKYVCNECGKYYSRSSDLQKHLYGKHGIDYVERCVGTIDDMDVEILNKAKMEINGNIVYHCELCGKNILTKRGYVRHVRVHTGERPFTCHVCGKQYRSSTDLTRHLRCVHDGIKNYQCDVCGRCFANKGTRNDHRRIHTGERPYVCHTCGKAFPTPNSIYVHRRIHTDYFPHQCTSCDKRFRRRQQLIHHIRTHTGEKPHACDLCGKRFGVKDEVTRHRLTHSNEKPHACSICGLCFGQKRYLKNHMKTHHCRLI